MTSFRIEAELLRAEYSVRGVHFYISPDGYFGSFYRGTKSFCNRPPEDNTTKGLGRECLLRLCQIADKYGVSLSLYATREKCVKLYEECGFKTISSYREDDGQVFRWDMERKCHELQVR